MKLSIAIAGEKALPSAFVVWRGFEESIRKASEMGYHGVELALKDAGEINPKKLELLLSTHNMQVSCISTGQVFADTGLYFTHPDPEARLKVKEIFYRLIDLAGAFGGMVNIGRVRGFIPDQQTRPQWEGLFLQTISDICRYAQKRNVQLVIEPVNRYELNFVNTLEEGAGLIRKSGCENLGLMPDVFHMNIEEANIEESLIRHAALLRYIHFADSNRLAPGQGHIRFHEIMKALGEIRYEGWISIEILPSPSPDVAAKQAATYTLKLLEEYKNDPDRKA